MLKSPDAQKKEMKDEQFTAVGLSECQVSKVSKPDESKTTAPDASIAMGSSEASKSDENSQVKTPDAQMMDIKAEQAVAEGNTESQVSKVSISDEFKATVPYDSIVMGSKDKPPEAKELQGLVDMEGNPFNQSAKDPSPAELATASVKSKLPSASAEKAAPVVPTLETPNEGSVTAQKTEVEAEPVKESAKDSEKSASFKESKDLKHSLKDEQKKSTTCQKSLQDKVQAVAKKPSVSTKNTDKSKQVSSRRIRKAKPEIINIDDDDEEEDVAKVSTNRKPLKPLAQDQPLIDPATYHRKFCRRLKKKEADSIMKETTTKLPPTIENMDRDTSKLPRMGMMDPMARGMMDRDIPLMGMMDPMSKGMMDQMNFNEMGGGMMNRMASGGGPMGIMGMGMGNRMMGMGMNDKMMAMGTNDGMAGRMSPDTRRMALGFEMGMNRGMMDDNFNPMMNMMRGMGGGPDGGPPMMPPGGNQPPGNLQELREMMGRDMKMDRMGGGMFNLMGSKGSAANANKVGLDGMAGALFNRFGSKGSAASKGANNGEPNPSKKMERFGSTDTGKGSGGLTEACLNEPMLPTPADIKPSFQKTYKDISFSPLDKLDRGLMAKMMALQDNDPVGMRMGGMGSLSAMGDMGPPSRMPFLPNNKRKLSDFAFSPRSPNPKKSFLERHRMMDLEMQGHLEEAMANFGRFQRKYSGGSGVNAMTDSTPVPMGVPFNKEVPDEDASRKKSAGDNKKKSKKDAEKIDKKKKKKSKSKETKDRDKPKRPFR
jgi:hypothetical protein